MPGKQFQTKCHVKFFHGRPILNRNQTSKFFFYRNLFFTLAALHTILNFVQKSGSLFKILILMSSSGVVLHLFCEETAVIVTWNVVVAVDDVEVVVVVVKRASPALHSRSARSNAPIKEIFSVFLKCTVKALAFHYSYITMYNGHLQIQSDGKMFLLF